MQYNPGFHRVIMDIADLLKCKRAAVYFFGMIILTPELKFAIPKTGKSVFSKDLEHPTFAAFPLVIPDRLQ